MANWKLTDVGSVNKNSISEGGIYCSSSWDGDISNYGILVVFSTGHPYISQLFFDVVTGSVYSRVSDNIGSSWKSWIKL